MADIAKLTEQWLGLSIQAREHLEAQCPPATKDEQWALNATANKLADKEIRRRISATEYAALQSSLNKELDRWRKREANKVTASKSG